MTQEIDKVIEQMVDLYSKHMIDPFPWHDESKEAERITYFRPVLESLKDHESEVNATIAGILKGISATFKEPDMRLHEGERFELSIFLDLLVQSLYDVGFNDLVVDITPYPFSTNDPNSYRLVVGVLTGEAEKPLRINYKGSFYNVGPLARNCEIEVRGETAYLGNRAENTSFKVNGEKREPSGV